MTRVCVTSLSLSLSLSSVLFTHTYTHSHTGTNVTTPYGDGVITKYRPYNDTYDVELSFGHVFIGADRVNGGSNNKNTTKTTTKKKKKSSNKKKSKKGSNEKMDVVEDDNNNKNSKVITTFIGDKSFYLYLRTYRILYAAFADAKRLAAPRAVIPSTYMEHRPIFESKESHSVSKRTPNQNSKDDYDRFLTLQCKVLRGEMESHIFEKQCQKMMGREGYTLICMDKIAREIVRHLFDLTVSNISKEYQKLNTEKSDIEKYVSQAEEISKKEEIAGPDFVGLFALTSKSGVPVPEAAANDEDKFTSIGLEQLRCGIPKPLSDTIGPANGWMEPPHVEIRFQPNKSEDDYSLAAALNQMIQSNGGGGGGGSGSSSSSNGGAGEEEDGASTGSGGDSK